MEKTKALEYDKQIREMADTNTVKEISDSLGLYYFDVREYCKENNIETLSKNIDMYGEEIRELSKTMTTKEIAKEIGYSESYIKAYCSKNDIHPVSDIEKSLGSKDKTIRELAKSKTTKELADAIGFGYYRVMNYCKEHNIETLSSRTIDDYDEKIRKLATKMTIPQIAREIRYSKAYVSLYCKENDIKVIKRNQRRVESYDEEIRDMVKVKTPREIAKELDFSLKDIYEFCNKNDLETIPDVTAYDRKDEIIEMAKTKTIDEIAHEVGYSRNKMSNFLRELGVQTVGVRRSRNTNHDWWRPLDIKIDNNTLWADYHQWWSFVYKRDSVRDVTFEKYRIANGYIREYYPDMHLDQVTRSVYQNFFNQLGKRLSKQTLMDTNNLIKRSLRDAEYEGLLKRDPTYGLELSGTSNSHSVNKFISEHELDKLLLALDYGTDLNNLQTKASWITFLAAKTGFRFGELLGLTVDSFDFEKNEITVNKTLNYKTGANNFQPTKNKSSMRTIFVDSMTMILFKNLIKDIDEDLPIFVADGKRMHNSSINDYLVEKCEEAEIPRISIHSLRHTHASVLLANGVSMQTVSKRLGHSNLSTTQNVYSHITDELTAKDSVRINSALSNLGGF